MRPFVPRAPALPALALAALGAAAQADPRGVTVVPGDTCAAAAVIPSLPFSLNFNNDLYTAGPPRGSCNAVGTTVMQNDAWLRWTAPASGTVSFTVDTLGYDGIAVVHQGPSCASLVPVQCADEPEPTVITFGAVSGQTYWFQCGDWGSTEQGGSTTVNITFSVLPGEACASAAEITFTPFQTTFNNDAFAPGAPAGACNAGGAGVMQNDAWYRWTAPGPGLLRLDLDPTNYDGIAVIYTGASCAALTPLACLDEPEPVAYSVPVQQGQTCWFQCGGRGAGESGGPTDFALDFIPAGETCEGAIEIGSTPFFTTFDNGASTADGPAGSCNAPGATLMQNDQWYRWTAPVSTPVRVCAATPAYDGLLQVYAGNSCNALVPLACADEPEPATVAFNAAAGTTYWFQCGDWGPTEGGGVTDFILIACIGDANFDGAVDFNDITAVLSAWLLTYPTCAGFGDANLDGLVDFNDITAVLANWLNACP